MKYLLTAILSVLLISGCGLSPVKQVEAPKSDEALLISTITANGCGLESVDIVKPMGRMSVKCK